VQNSQTQTTVGVKPAAPPSDDGVEKLAVIVTHGMGQQVAFETLEMLADAVRTEAASRNPGAPPPPVATRVVRLGTKGGPTEPQLPRAELRVFLPDGTPRDYPGTFDGTPVFLGCSDVDPHIRKDRVLEAEDVFMRMGARVSARLYPQMGHTVNADEIQAVRDMVAATAEERRRVRKAHLGAVFQDPMTSLDPTMRVGKQVIEAAGDSEEARRLLELVGVPDPLRRMKAFPHELSGGLRQRVMIAMAVAGKPDLVIADEPTTALDVTVQAQILELIQSLQAEFGMAVVFITHDMGVVAEMADRVAVMYAGRIVEQGTKRDLFYDPQHPYTWGLLGSIARLDRPRPRRLTAIAGQPPSMINRPAGCSFRPRCPQAFDRCKVEDPLLTAKVGSGHLDACHLSVEDKRTRRDATIHPELAESA